MQAQPGRATRTVGTTGKEEMMNLPMQSQPPRAESKHPDVLYVSHADALALLSVEQTMRICEDVFHMHARGSVFPPLMPSFKLDDDEFHNHWHVKSVLLKDVPVTGVRLYNYYDDGDRNTVGNLDCARYVVLTDPRTGHALAMVDEHLSYAWRSAAAAVVPSKWVAPAEPRVLGLVGAGTMCAGVLECLATLYKFEEVRVTSRRAESREGFARKWSEKLGINVRPVETNEEVVRGADIAVGGTTSADVMIYDEWVKPGALVISLARQQFELAGFARMDKVIVDGWDLNMKNHYFRKMVDTGLFSREQLHAEIAEVVSGAKPGRERADERILVHTTGLVSQDVAIAHWLFEQAKATGRGIWLPAARE
jgi:ornithine cyclodeaminase/alanine dehydrogenase-like protein (mu-crystallin family)